MTEASFRAGEMRGTTDMVEAHRTREELAELADGRLEPEVRAAIEAHLSVCVACRNEFEAQRNAKSFAALHFAPAAVPPHLSQRVIAALQHAGRSPATRLSHNWWLAAAGVAAVALLTVTLFLLWPQRKFAADVANSYQQFTTGTVQLEFATQDSAALERWFRESGIHFETRVFDLGMMQYQLAGGRLHRVATHSSAFFVYRGPRNEILICQMYLGSVSELSAPLALRDHNGIRFHVHRHEGITLVFWQEGQVVCVLASDGDLESVIQLAFAKAVKVEESPR